MSKQSDLEMRYGGVTFEDAIHAFVIDTPKIDADPIEAENTLADLFEYYGVQRLSMGFAKLDMPSKQYLLVGIAGRYIAALTDDEAPAPIKLSGGWQLKLSRKGKK